MRYFFADYCLDTQCYELHQAGVPIPLPPKVFQVLAYLLAQGDRVVSKEELLGATKRNSGMARVTWTAGVVRLHISTAQVAEGYARTMIRASFRGYGQNADQFALPREYWDLESNNNLETSITSDLQAHFKASQ